MQENYHMTDKSRIYKWGNIYGLKLYIPALGYLRQMSRDMPEREESQWVIGFKLYRKHVQKVHALVRMLAIFLDCGAIWAIPPSDISKQPSPLQAIFGREIERIISVKPRKYRHTKDLPHNYGQTYAIKNSGIAEKILLIDDVVRTGATLCHFHEALTKNGINIAMAAIGMYYKAPYEIVGALAAFERQEISEVDKILDGMKIL